MWDRAGTDSGRGWRAVVWGIGALLLVTRVTGDATAQEKATDAKVLTATFVFEEKGVHFKDALVNFGTERILREVTKDVLFKDFWFQLVDASGPEPTVLDEYVIWDPRKMAVDEGPKRGEFVEVSQASYSMRFGFNPRATEVRVLDADKGKPVAVANICQAIEAFCVKHEGDAECGNWLKERLMRCKP